jgi:multidrug efflux system outer membrane protein
VKAIDAPVASSVLLQRPDVLADEHRLAAAHADVAAARAAFFPQISLTVFGGYASSALSQLVSQRSRFDAIEDGISVPLFDGGFRRAQLRGTLATRKQAAALYQKTLQRAFKEVADLISDRTTLEAEVDADTRGVADTDAAYHLSVRRYEAGVGGFLDVLIEQRSLYQVQQRLTSTRLRLACNRVTLFKALGGGLDA